MISITTAVLVSVSSIPTTRLTSKLQNHLTLNFSIDICPKEDEGNDKGMESHVKLFESTNEDLFDLFAIDDDLTNRWRVFNEPITTSNSTTIMNCTMAYLASCVDMYKCESSCISMGASGYRWFHIGCCECFGKYCTNFGLNQPRCRQCPTGDSIQVIDSGGLDSSL